MLRVLLVAATALLCACASTAQNHPHIQSNGSNRANAKNGSLKPFESEDALRRTLADVERLREKDLARRKREREECQVWEPKVKVVGVDCDAAIGEKLMVSAPASVELDTNNQHAGVDEGGLVKKAGDVVVVLRRGRLFTIDTSGGTLASVDVANLGSSNDKDGDADRYDELLVHGRTVIVIGYSYQRGGTEIVFFDLRERGRLEYRATYTLGSLDYYSCSNYVSRLVGGRLLLYTTFTLPDNPDGLDWLPAVRRRTPGRESDGFERISSADRIFKPAAPLGPFPRVHSFVACDVASVEFTCDGSVLLGDALSVYYASPTAAYAWPRAWSNEGADANGMLYRIPFDGAPVSALAVYGSPTDQLSFLESDDGYLNVVVVTPPDLVPKLLRISLDTFADGSTAAALDSYHALASRLDQGPVRFVGDYVVLGANAWADDAADQYRVVVSSWRSPAPSTIVLPHSIERIDAIGKDAVVSGASDGGSLQMTTVRLTATPTIAATLRLDSAYLNESRSHAFLYHADSARAGLFGLPFVLSTWGSKAPESSRILFVRNQDLAMSVAGTLDAAGSPPADEHDWYGNSRPLFSGDRVFALMGYELVEGQVGANGLLREIGRLNFAQRPAMR
jgi:hypothetical protein